LEAGDLAARAKIPSKKGSLKILRKIRVFEAARAL
jgi:hypothetical protein